MFNLFKKKIPVLPPFETLAAYKHRDKYFFRVAAWYRHDDHKIAVIDPHASRIITMDTWPQVIFLGGATGKRTVKEYIEYVAAAYKGEIPQALDAGIIKSLEGLLSEKLVKLSHTPVQLPKHIEKPKVW